MPSTREPMAVAFTMSGGSCMSVLEDAAPLAIGARDSVRVAVHDQPAAIEPDEPAASGSEKVEVVRHEHRGNPACHERVDAREALLHEELVADAEYLVHEQDVRFDIESERKGEPCVHAGREVLHGLVHESVDPREPDDAVESRIDPGPRQSEERAGEAAVLGAAQVR